MIINKTLVLLFGIFGLNTLNAQETNETTLKNILSTKTFVFKAQSAWPLQGTVVQLTPGFDTKVLGDSINAHRLFGPITREVLRDLKQLVDNTLNRRRNGRTLKLNLGDIGNFRA